MKLPLIYLLLTVLIISFSCKKEEEIEELPPATQNGFNTFGCLMDGEVWLPKKSKTFFWSGRPEVEINFGYSKISGKYSINLDANRITNHTGIRMGYGYITGPGIYKLWGKPERRLVDSNVHMYFTGDKGLCYTIPDKPGTLNLTFIDTIRKIIAGRFEFDSFCEYDSTFIKIRNGRFDWNYE